MKMLRDQKFYYIGKKLGLKKEDLDLFLNNINNIEEQPSFSARPPWYPGTHYGTISIKDF